MSEIGELERELFETESKLEQAKVARDVSGRSFKRGMLGILLGVIFLLLATNPSNVIARLNRFISSTSR